MRFLIATYALGLSLSAQAQFFGREILGKDQIDFCPSGFAKDGNLCVSDIQKCSLEKGFHGRDVRMGEAPEISCPQGFYDGYECVYEDVTWPDVRCPPGFKEKLVDGFSGLTDGTGEPDIRKYVCLVERRYTALQYCRDEGARFRDGTCFVPSEKPAFLKCPEGFSLWDHADLCVADEPVCPPGSEARVIASRKTANRMLRFSEDYKKRWDKNQDGEFDESDPLTAVCIWYEPAHLGPSKKGECPSGYLYDDAVKGKAEDYSMGACVKISTSVAARPMVVPTPDCLQEGSVWDESTQKCIRWNQVQPWFRCREGDRMINAGLSPGMRPWCIQYIETESQPECKDFWNFSVRVFPQNLLDRLDWRIKKEKEPETPQPLCSRTRTTAPIISCERGYEFMEGGECVKFRNDDARKSWASCSADTTPLITIKTSELFPEEYEAEAAGDVFLDETGFEGAEPPR
uniref:Sushi domain-containing protein n=1 Tax=Chromera velia CCMP2878 TaxID=1169474 RepID=A0A0G4GE06_9ALVE|mmetsp:Transcript_2226/g.4687  ORF Transcript_2226/g.4687 Transcript_2226/m.4687 type:complete len:459 (+) Transcript_2226:188-1564(+)|eukprot:Cvel_21483.t1-p1 / transcript=Cvel_21483.t1 / gene=Cvel_21483 / organism=Chromera_velia_CCMP2878 / gene_product=hypothetical protein / transcript_product=hypothetical protein / location=Cvel_scaffold2018:1671-10654(+) / protein_length=458 / sequence_SO=supercontig / SO=protein_coding / is_pseudo=false